MYGVVYIVIDKGKLPNQIARLQAIAVKLLFLRLAVILVNEPVVDFKSLLNNQGSDSKGIYKKIYVKKIFELLWSDGQDYWEENSEK